MCHEVNFSLIILNRYMFQIFFFFKSYICTTLILLSRLTLRTYRISCSMSWLSMNVCFSYIEITWHYLFQSNIKCLFLCHQLLPLLLLAVRQVLGEKSQLLTMITSQGMYLFYSLIFAQKIFVSDNLMIFISRKVSCYVMCCSSVSY